MHRYKLITPEGTGDLLFSECARRRAVEKEICKIFSRACYNEVRTPTVEFYDVFDVSARAILPEHMYKLTDSKGRLLVLRPDSTMPIARMVASKLRDARLPVRIYYNQSSFRISQSIRGRRDETPQVGVELIGADGKLADLEILSLAVRALSSCTEDFRLEIGHSGIFRALSRQLPVSEDKVEELREFIELKNYAALSAELDMLPDSQAVRALKQLPRLFGGVEVLERAYELVEDENARAQLSYLGEIYGCMSRLGLGDKLSIDLGLVNQNNYYTGLVFAAYTQGSGESVLLGGRYDKLLEEFGAPNKACGFAVNLNALIKAISPRDETSAAVPEVVVFAAPGYEIEALKHAAQLGEQGVIHEISATQERSEAVKRAAERGAARVDIVAESVETITL